MRVKNRSFKIIVFLMTALLLFHSEMSVYAGTMESVPALNAGQEEESGMDRSQQDYAEEDFDEGEPEADPEEDSEPDVKEESETDVKEEPETDAKEESETDVKEEPETDPTDNPETEPEDVPDTDPEEDSEENSEEEPASDEESEETGSIEEEETAISASSEEDAIFSLAALAAPKNLKLDNAHPYIKTLTWDAVEGAVGYEVYYAVDFGLAGGSLDTNAYKLLGRTDDNTFTCDLTENEELNPDGEFNHYPAETQYYSYRVKAVCQGEEEEIAGSFSEPVCSNGMYADSLPYINKKRTEYGLPGRGHRRTDFVGGM